MLGDILAFIVNLVFDFYVFLLLLRVILQKLGANWHNPLTQFVVRFTEPVIKPVRRFIPGYRGIDYSIVVVALVVEIIEMLLDYLLTYGMFPAVVGVVVFVIASLIAKTLNIFFFATIIWAILSWFSSAQHHPLAEAVGLIAMPLVTFARRYIPLVAGFDLSPIVVIVAIELINLIAVNPLMSVGLRLALG